MKCKQLIIHLLVTLMLLSLFGCADISGDGNGTDLPGSGEISGEITTDAVTETEAGTETDAAQTEPETSAPSAAVVDLSEITYYWYKEDGEKKNPEVSDLAIKAMEEYFAGFGSVKVTGLLMSKKVNEENKSVPHHYTYDIEADGRKYTLEMTFDNEITIAPYLFDDLIAESEEGLVPVRPDDMYYYWTDANKVLSFNGHSWTVKEGELLCDGTVVFKTGVIIKNVVAADIDGNGIKEALILSKLDYNDDMLMVLYVFDTITGKVIQRIPQVIGASQRIRYEGGSIADYGKKLVSVNKEGELVMADYRILLPGVEPESEWDKGRVYKVCYDPSSEHLRLVFVREFEFDSGIAPDDERIIG